MKTIKNKNRHETRRFHSLFYQALIAWFLFFPFSLSAEEHTHAHARNEIGLSPGLVYSPSHNSFGFGIHAHYFRTLDNHSPWALGGSLEHVSLHGTHWTLSAGAKYQILDDLSFSIMPGITFFNHNHSSHKDDDHHPSRTQLSVHLELAYDLIHLEHFHFGPAIDYSFSRHDSHFMLGIHCAYAF